MSRSQLIRTIRNCKSIKKLTELETDPTFLSAGCIDWPEFKKHKEYLEAKQRADKAAYWINMALSLLGVGVICGIAMFMVLPIAVPFALLPIVAQVGIGAALLAVSLVAGYVERPVYFGFIKKSCRNLFARGIFQTIDNNLLKKDAKKRGKTRHELIESEKQAILNSKKNIAIRYLKYTLSVLGGVVSIVAAIGFSGLAYMQVADALLKFGVIAGMAATALPWVFAAVAGLYFFVMFGMIYDAIKNNIFKKIGKQIQKLYANQSLGMCVLKTLGLVFVLGIAIVATIFTAGAWLQGSVGFFRGAFGIVKHAAEKIGLVIGSVLLATNLSFSIHNSLKSFALIVKMLKHPRQVWDNITAYCNAAIDRIHAEASLPKKIAIACWEVSKPLIRTFVFLLHVLGVGFVASQGAEAFVLQGVLGPSEILNRVVAGSTESVVEILEDAHTLIDHHADGKDHHHDHEHADPAADLEWLAGKVKAAAMSAVTFFKEKCSEPVRQPEFIERHTLSS